MFRSAATKIAHNSTIPALAGNQDLRSLQDLITAEKAVIISLQRLATDFSKAAEALKTWGLGEGDDLGNILGASTAIIAHFTTAVSQYASHGPTMREQLKAIRTREEQLDELRRRRRNLISKADSAEKKLQKMGPEHKNLVQQTDILYRLKADIGTLDIEIMSQEAAIGDFKRTATRSWMGLKFGGLLECCEKGVIVGEYGKLVVAEISEDKTQPGLPRNPYLAHPRIENLLADTHRYVNEVRLSTVPSAATQPRLQIPSITESSSFFGSPLSSNARYPQQPQSPTTDFPYVSYDRQEHPNIGLGRILDSPVDAAHPSPFTIPREPLHMGSLSNPSTVPYPAGNLDEFGSSLGSADVSSAGGAGSVGRFATFPVKSHTASASGVGLGTYNQYRVDTPPIHEHESSPFSLLSTPPQREQSGSFVSSVTQALAAASGSHGRTLGGQEYPGVADIQQESHHDDDDEPLPPPGRPGRLSKDGPAPSYELSVHDSPLLRGVGSRSLVDGSARRSDPGAGKSGLVLDDGTISDDDDVETVSAYVSASAHPDSTATTPSETQVGDKHVRFGVVSNIDSPDAPPAILPPMTPPDLTSSSPGPTTRGEGAVGTSGGEGNCDTASTRDMSSEEKEKVLNAAAAREIAFELQQSQSQFHPPSTLANARDRPSTPATLNITVSSTADAPPLPARESSTSPSGVEYTDVNTMDKGASLSNIKSLPSYSDKPVGAASLSARRVPVPPLKDKQKGQWEFEEQGGEEGMFNPYEDAHTRAQQQRERYRDYEPYNYEQEREGGNYTMEPASISHGTYQDAPPGPRVEFKSSSSGLGLGIRLEQPNAPYMRSGMGENTSSSSLNSSGGGGKISAAAFKRPSPRLGSGNSNSFPSLVSSQFSPSSGGGGGGGGDTNTGSKPSLMMPGLGNNQQRQERRETRELDVNQYGYINAYVDSTGTGAGAGDSDYYMEQHTSVGGGNGPQRHEQGQGRGGGGYEQGKFTTNLEYEYDNYNYDK